MSNKAIVIAGPTGVGKTDISIKLAKILNADIISADSAQLYKDMNIGTAKITEEEKDGIKHYMIDVVEPISKYNVGEYERKVSEILQQKEKEGKNIIIVGGTGLYIDAITEGLSVLPTAKPELRETFSTKTKEELYSELLKYDEEAAKNIEINNRNRIERALEVCLLTREKFSVLSKKNIKNNKYQFTKFFLDRDREELYERINKRVDIMMEQGLEKEVIALVEKYGTALKKLNIIGYSELIAYLESEITLERAIYEIKRNSRHYAKRQLTWFSKRTDYKRINCSIMSENEIISTITNSLI